MSKEFPGDLQNSSLTDLFRTNTRLREHEQVTRGNELVVQAEIFLKATA
jgi:hypothetical protein